MNGTRLSSLVGVLALRPLLATAVLLAVPLAAMQVTDEVVWTVSDFVVAGALVFATGTLLELAWRRAETAAYRIAAAVALAAGFLLVWGILAVGVIGASGDRADLLYAGVFTVGIVGALLARFRPRGMAWVMAATAVAQVAVGGVALIAGMVPAYNAAYEILGLSGFFAALWLLSACLFRRAARAQASLAPAPEERP